MDAEQSRADIKARNAGEECITVWKDGSFVHHGCRDAELAFRCEPDVVLVTIRLADLRPVKFLTRNELATHHTFMEKVLAAPIAAATSGKEGGL